MRRLILALVLLSSDAFGQVLYTADWESFPGAPWVPFSGGVPAIDCTVPASPSGGCALKFTYPAGTYSTSFSAGRAELALPSSPTELWIGHWNRYSSGFVWNGNGTKMDFLVLADRGQFNFPGNMAVGWKGNPNAPTEVASNQIVWGPTTQDFWCGYTATTNEWVWIEEHYRINTPGASDGVFELYVNDAQNCSYSNVPYRDSSVTSGWGTFLHTAEWGGGGGTVPSTQYWWVDHTVLSTTRIGRPGGTPVGDTTAPTPPTGLTVN